MTKGMRQPQAAISTRPPEHNSPPDRVAAANMTRDLLAARLPERHVKAFLARRRSSAR